MWQMRYHAYYVDWLLGVLIFTFWWWYLYDATFNGCCYISAQYAKGLLTEGFFWIPSLAGPTTIAARQNGSGISWLFPFVVSISLRKFN